MRPFDNDTPELDDREDHTTHSRFESNRVECGWCRCIARPERLCICASWDGPGKRFRISLALCSPQLFSTGLRACSALFVFPKNFTRSRMRAFWIPEEARWILLRFVYEPRAARYPKQKKNDGISVYSIVSIPYTHVWRIVDFINVPILILSLLPITKHGSSMFQWRLVYGRKGTSCPLLLRCSLDPVQTMLWCEVI